MSIEVAYLLSGTTLTGGVKVVLQHVRILRRRGIDAVAVSTTPPPTWFPGGRRLHRRVARLERSELGPVRVAVGTLWDTVPGAVALGEHAVHFCQGYEGDYEPYRHHWPEIERVFALPTRKWVCAPNLAELIRKRFGQEAAVIPQPFEARRFRPPLWEPRGREFRLLLPGQWQVSVKGIPWAMRALAPLRRESPPLRLVRLVQDVTEEETRAWPDPEYHVHVRPRFVPRIYRRVHAVLCPSSGEGFGLPVLEALAAGRPCVVTDIPAFRDIDPEARGTLRVPYGDDEALRGAVRRLRDDPSLRRALSEGGPPIGARYSEERTGEVLEAELGAL